MKKSTKRAIGALVLLAILGWHYALPLERGQKPDLARIPHPQGFIH